MESGSSILRPLMEEHRNLKLSEKTALESLKQKLNSLYKNNKVSMWGIPLTVTSSSDESDVILSKFLRETNFVVEDSFEKLVNCLSWRKESIVEENLGFEDLENYVACSYEFDRQGHPVCYINYGIFFYSLIYRGRDYRRFMHDKIFQIEENRLKFIRWRVQLLEKVIKKLNFKNGGVNSIIMVYDLRDEFSKDIQLVEDHIYSIIKDYYPGIVSRKIHINAPWYDRMLHSLSTRFVTQRDSTMGELVVANEESVFETLYKYIRPERIPIKYGGVGQNRELTDVPIPVFEIAIEGGVKLNIPIKIEGYSKVTLTFVVGGWDLEYWVKFIPDAAASFADMLEEDIKMKASDFAVHMSYDIVEAGKLVLTIDNTASRKLKVVAYRYEIV